MPTVTRPASHGANRCQFEPQASSDSELLRYSCPDHYMQCESIIQSSFDDVGGSGTQLYGSENGFVEAAINSYNLHHHLIIRPEDVWFAILSQLNLFMKQNAEEVRSFFVAHQGQKELEVKDLGARGAYDFSKMAKKMTDLIKKNLVDPSFSEWVMPNFTTTTDTDRTVAAILMMGGLQGYYGYKLTLRCGLPSVTLLGDRSDWVALLTRIELLPKLGPETTQWYRLLKPVLTRFVGAFDSPESSETKDFWQTIVHYSAGGSGPSYVSGWITAFCFWDWEGRSLFTSGQGNNTNAQWTVLDGVRYHRVDTNDVPPGFASVPVKLDDNGDEYDTVMVAGSVGFKATSSGELLTPSTFDNPSITIELDTLQSESGWWMYEKKEGPMDPMEQLYY
ncbi:protein of unknown function (DUF4419) domain containing protein [Elaphomyces granulatus]